MKEYLAATVLLALTTASLATSDTLTTSVLPSHPATENGISIVRLTLSTHLTNYGAYLYDGDPEPYEIEEYQDWFVTTSASESQTVRSVAFQLNPSSPISILGVTEPIIEDDYWNPPYTHSVDISFRFLNTGLHSLTPSASWIVDWQSFRSQLRASRSCDIYYSFTCTAWEYYLTPAIETSGSLAFDVQGSTVSVSAVPEPHSIFLMLSGLLCIFSLPTIYRPKREA
jgi:hypothetical protein